ncbi:MAG: ribosome-associated protein [Lentisphaeria bacterium]|jgi:ribosome-associated protein
MKEVMLNKEPVELFKILKYEGLAGSGGEAKLAIADSQAKVNGEIETRKRKKIMAGDIIEFGNIKMKMVLDAK